LLHDRCLTSRQDRRDTYVTFTAEASVGDWAEVWEPDSRMSREDYLGWVEQQPSGKFERIDGVVVAMGP